MLSTSSQRKQIASRLDEIGLPEDRQLTEIAELGDLFNKSVAVGEYDLSIRALLLKALSSLDPNSEEANLVRLANFIAVTCLPAPDVIQSDLLEQIAKKTAILRHVQAGIRSWQDFLHAYEEEFAGFSTHMIQRSPEFTSVELKIAALVAKDYSSGDICRILAISEKTLYNHRADIRRKLRLERGQVLQRVLASMLWSK
jgi:DNA-binding CsgD family transcriptional regulator